MNNLEQAQRIEDATIKAVQDVLEEIEGHFLDKKYTTHRLELSKKYWNKLKRRFDLE